MRHVKLGVLLLVGLVASSSSSMAQLTPAARAARVAELRTAVQDTFGLQVESLDVGVDSVVSLVLVEGTLLWNLDPKLLQDSARHVAWWLWGKAEWLGPVRVLTICCRPSSQSLPIGPIYKARPEAPK